MISNSPLGSRWHSVRRDLITRATIFIEIRYFWRSSQHFKILRTPQVKQHQSRTCIEKATSLLMIRWAAILSKQEWHTFQCSKMYCYWHRTYALLALLKYLARNGRVVLDWAMLQERKSSAISWICVPVNARGGSINSSNIPVFPVLHALFGMFLDGLGSFL